MFYAAFCLIFIITCAALLRKAHVPYACSAAAGLGLALALLASIALAQNYNYSRIPGIHDGLGISK
ncbi:Na+-transporting NADH:ubiquinone oxidoreductase subunit NqrE [Paenibacillus mucilaginosus]|uniref:hypothetical protein n=1 Tax=Paenibacillus mucilaginosus TaxID=61624 RepID=UPI003D258BAA